MRWKVALNRTHVYDRLVGHLPGINTKEEDSFLSEGESAVLSTWLATGIKTGRMHNNSRLLLMFAILQGMKMKTI